MERESIAMKVRHTHTHTQSWPQIHESMYRSNQRPLCILLYGANPEQLYIQLFNQQEKGNVNAADKAPHLW